MSFGMETKMLAPPLVIIDKFDKEVIDRQILPLTYSYL